MHFADEQTVSITSESAATVPLMSTLPPPAAPLFTLPEAPWWTYAVGGFLVVGGLYAVFGKKRRR